MTKVRWSTEEVEAVVKRFIQLRLKDLTGSHMVMLREAQECLPEDRRRNPPTLDNYGHAVMEVIERETAKLARYFEPVNKAVEPPSRIIEPKTELFGQTLRMPLGGSLVEIPFPMQEEDFDLLLSTVQLWKSKLTNRPVVPAPIEAKAKQEIHEVTTVEIAKAAEKIDERPLFRVTPKPVVEPPPAPVSSNGKCNVAIIGLLGPHRAMLKDEWKKFPNLTVSIVDEKDRELTKYVIDHAIISTGTAPHWQAEYARRKFIKQQGRLHYATGIVEVRRMLTEIDNSH